MRALMRFLSGCCLLVTLAACRGDRMPAEVTPKPAVVAEQWAIAAEASSRYASPDWSPARATGAPDVQMCADDPRAWASARGNGLEWLQLRFEKPVYATEVRAFQTLGPGAIARVHLIDVAGGQNLVWEGTDTSLICPAVFTASFPRTDYLVVGVRLELDESRTGFWNQIDAVELVGILP